MKLTPINPHFNACDQNWELMPEQDGGRLCESCEKVLIDFTSISEETVLNQQRANDFKLCGRYTRNQVDRLHRHLTLEETETNRPWLVSLAMGLSSMLPLGVAAQDSVIKMGEIKLSEDSSAYQTVSIVAGGLKPPSLENEVVAVDTVKVPVVYTVPMPGAPGNMQYPMLDVNNANELIEIKGTVKEADTGEPIPFANVWIGGTKTGTTTDFDGNFSIKVPVSYGAVTLITSYVGYEGDSTEIDLTSAGKGGDTIDMIELSVARSIIGIIYIKSTFGQKLKRWSNPVNWYRAIRNRIRYR